MRQLSRLTRRRIKDDAAVDPAGRQRPARRTDVHVPTRSPPAVSGVLRP